MSGGKVLSSKRSKQAVAYQETPKGEERCNGCSMWTGSESCNAVFGRISPRGWCKIYEKRASR